MLLGAGLLGAGGLCKLCDYNIKDELNFNAKYKALIQAWGYGWWRR